MIVTKFLPIDLLKIKHTTFERYTSFTSLNLVNFFLILLSELLYSTLGEEIFFRGFIANLLFRKFNFNIANFTQSLIFVLPHLLLLTLSKSLWPFLMIDFIVGLMLGWLLHHSKSIFPGLLTHTLVNTLFVFFLLESSL